MKHKIEVEVEEVKNDEMFMTLHYGDGSLGKTKFDASFTLPAYSLLVTVGEKRYKLSQQSVIANIVRLHQKK